MNADRLLAHYDQIADAPDAIARLRRFILDLAVRGKLVAQEIGDEAASVLLQRIEAEKLRLEASGELRREKPLPDIDVDNVPFVIPKSWEWVPIRRVLSPRGQTVPKSDFTYIDVTAFNKEIGRIENASVLTPIEAPSRARKIAKKGDVLYSCVRPYLLNIAVIEHDIEPPPIASTAFAVLNGFDLVLAWYQWIVLRSPFFVSCVEEKMRGQAYPAINDADFAQLPFPLPPLAEQHRIVAKVDELMALCDQLEAARVEREATRDRLTAATLARLSAPDPDTFADDTRFALDALPALTTRPDQIRQLRQTILNLAVRGKLVPQDPDDEPASELLKQVSAERADLVRRKVIRRDAPLDVIQESECSFQIPTAWSWSRVGDAVLFTQYGTSQKAQASRTGAPVLTMGNIRNGLVVWSNEKRIPESSDELPDLYLQKFDLLYNRTNSAELVGKTGIYLGEDDRRTFASYLIRLRPSLEWTEPRFLNLAMNTSWFRETQVVPHVKKQTGQANVNGTALKNMILPIPPLAEQRRIVAKVDALMAVCDQLESSLNNADQTRRKLLDALLADALAPVEARDAVMAG